MEDSFNKITWIAVSVGIIALVYLAMKKFVPDLLDTIRKHIQDFVEQAFNSMTGTDNGGSSGSK